MRAYNRCTASLILESDCWSDDSTEAKCHSRREKAFSPASTESVLRFKREPLLVVGVLELARPKFRRRGQAFFITGHHSVQTKFTDSMIILAVYTKHFFLSVPSK